MAYFLPSKWGKTLIFYKKFISNWGADRKIGLFRQPLFLFLGCGIQNVEGESMIKRISMVFNTLSRSRILLLLHLPDRSRRAGFQAFRATQAHVWIYIRHLTWRLLPQHFAVTNLGSSAHSLFAQRGIATRIVQQDRGFRHPLPLLAVPPAFPPALPDAGG